MAVATARLKLIGASKVMAALRGLRQANESTNRKARSEVKKTERAVGDAAASEVSAQKQAAKKGADAVATAEKRKRDEIKKTTREATRAAREQEQDARRAVRRQQNEQARLRGSLGRRVAGAGLGMAAGAAAGAAQMGSTAQGVVGVRSGQDVLSSLVDTQADLVRTVAQARQGALQSLRRSGGDTSAVEGMDIGDVVNSMTARSAEIGARNGVSTEEIMQAISRAEEQFSQVANAVQGGAPAMDELFATMERMAQVSRASGTSMEMVTTAGFAMQRQLQLSTEEAGVALDILNQGALEGSLTLEDFAERFPQAISTFLAARGGLENIEGGGLAALQEFAAIAQALKSGSDADSRIVQTELGNMMAALSDRKVQRNLRREGVEVVADRETGAIRDVGSIIAAMTAANEGQGFSLQQLRGLGLNQEGARAMSQMMSAERGSGATVTERSAASAASGAEFRVATNAALDDSAAGQALRARAEREARLATQSEELITQFTSLARRMSEFEDAFPMLTHGGGGSALGSTFGGLGIGAGVAGMLGGGGAGTGVATSAAAGAGTAGAGTVGAVVAAGSVIGLGIGRAIGHAVDAVTGGEGSNSMVAAQSEIFATVMDPQRSLLAQIADGIQSLREGPAQPGRARIPQRVELTPNSTAAIAAAAAAQAPGSGRRTDGGPAERTP